MRKTRKGIASDAYREVRWFRDALDESDYRAAWKSTERLLSLGGEERAHAGMVRCIVFSQLALRWKDLEALAPKLKKLARASAARK